MTLHRLTFENVRKDITNCGMDAKGKMGKMFMKITPRVILLSV